MASLKEVRGRIKSIQSTQQITKAMKMVAAAKLRRAQDRIIGMRPYAEKLETILHNLTAMTGGDATGVYAEEREPNQIILVVVTSDRGLCGAFNANVCKAAMAKLKGDYKTALDEGRVRMLCVGKKGYDYFTKRISRDLVMDDYVGLFGNLQFDEAKQAAEFLMSEFTAKKVDRVEFFYNEFKNVATQFVRNSQFLPAVAEETEEEKDTMLTDYIFEPSKEYIINDLIPKSLKIQFYKALLESNASEHGARMTAMDKATDNAGELLKELKLTYNRTRQAAITTEILEIVAGAEALSSN